MNKVLAVAAVMLLAGVASASVIVGGTAPTTNIYLSQTAEGDPINSNDVRYQATAYRTAGQNFTATTSTIVDAITFKGQSEARGNPLPMTLKVWELSSIYSDPYASGVLLGSESGSVAYTADTAQYITFDLTTDISIVAGHVYGFEVVIDGPAASAKRYGDPGMLVSAADNPYVDGNPIRLATTAPGAGAYNHSSDDVLDMVFYIQDVPEPATLTVLGLGALAMLRRRK